VANIDRCACDTPGGALSPTLQTGGPRASRQPSKWQDGQAPPEEGDSEPTAERSRALPLRMRWVLRKPDGRQGFIPATGEPQADAFEEGAHPCSMGLRVLVWRSYTFPVT
jgi:hypothetical protein